MPCDAKASAKCLAYDSVIGRCCLMTLNSNGSFHVSHLAGNLLALSTNGAANAVGEIIA